MPAKKYTDVAAMTAGVVKSRYELMSAEIRKRNYYFFTIFSESLALSALLCFILSVVIHLN